MSPSPEEFFKDLNHFCTRHFGGSHTQELVIQYGLEDNLVEYYVTGHVEGVECLVIELHLDFLEERVPTGCF